MIKSTHDPANMRFRLPFQSILTAFQIGNPNIYTVTRDNPELSQGFLDMVGGLMVERGIREGVFLSGIKECSINDLAIHYRFSPYNEFVCALAYRLERPGYYPEDHFSLVIGSIDATEEKKVVQPHYILCGEICKNLFLPAESVCLVEQEDGKMVMMEASDEDELYATLCYADTALKAVISGFPLDMEQNILFLTKEARPTVCSLFNHMTQRDSETLTQEIREGVVYRDGRGPWSPPSLQ